jgi:outer membrane protein assembly factor BamE
MQKIILTAMLFVMSFGLTGCIHPFVPNIQQGNVLTSEVIGQLKVGMSKDEVRELLGDPVLTNIFDRRCFVYAYTNQINGGKINSEHVTVCFDANGHLKTIQK